MNKKVLTLCVGLLLGGGALNFTNANDWSLTTNNNVVNTEKYFVISQTGNFNGSTWTTAGYGVLFLAKDSKGDVYYSSGEKDKKAYWRINMRKNLTSGNLEYQLVNANDGKPLAITHPTDANAKVEWFLLDANGSQNALYFLVGANRYYLTPENKNNIWYVGCVQDNNGKGADGFNDVEIDEESISVKDLNAELQGGFQIQIGKSGKNAYEEFENWAVTEKGFGNVFAGKLTAVDVNDKTNTDAEEFYLKSGDKYIVLTDALWGGTNSDLNGKDHYKGYQFELVSAHTFETTYKDKKNNAIFKIEKTYDFDQAYGDSLIVSMPRVKVGDMSNATDVRLFVADVNNKSYLTIIESEVANDRLTEDDAKELPYVRFGASNIVDFKQFAGKVWNITDEQGNVLAPDVYWRDADYFYKYFDPAEQIQLNKPEGHWLSTGIGFINRESGASWNFNTDFVIRKTGTPNLYEVYSDKYTNSVWEKVYITEAKDAELGKTEIGYAQFDEAKEALDGKYLTLTDGLTKEIVYVGKDADDNVILTKDKANAIEFRIKDLRHNYTDHEGMSGVDTLQHITTYMGLDKDGNVVEAQDTLQFYHYRLYETFSEKYLTYDNATQKYILVAGSTDNNAHDDFHRYYYGNDSESYDASISTFVLKEKQNGTYNLISRYKVDYDRCDVDENGKHTIIAVDEKTPFDNDMTAYLYQYSSDSRYMTEKMYGAFQTATLSNMSYIYKYNDNDRFALANVDAPEYMTITGSQDTVKISAKDFTNFFLYEQNQNGTNFLGMNHVADVEDMKAAILADTAYVRNNTNRPQYLLAVGTDIKPEIPCEIPGHPTLHPDTVYGRFLVNMVDSAKAWTGSDKTNPYIWNKNSYYRLAFIDGYHTGDALTLNTAKAKTKIALNNNNDKVCTFAFRYVDEAREGVKIETAYGPADANGNRTRGWLKYQNHFAVVTNDYDDADVFYVDNTTTDAPTANEEISAGNVVVAGVNGAVVVKGAEGKNVIVSTILGKVVANEVVSSDNATIAAPAGIVVVSVDGESFKVVVK